MDLQMVLNLEYITTATITATRKLVQLESQPPVPI